VQQTVANNAVSTGGVTGKGFKPGQSGNPSGRPPIAKEFRDKCRNYMEAGEGGWDKLVSLASKSKPQIRIRALELITAYAYGKPAQAVEVTGGDGAPVVVRLEGEAEKWAK